MVVLLIFSGDGCCKDGGTISVLAQIIGLWWYKMGGKVGIGGIKGGVGRLSSIAIVQNPDVY